MTGPEPRTVSVTVDLDTSVSDGNVHFSVAECVELSDGTTIRSPVARGWTAVTALTVAD